jgi:hypothetical protein
MHCYEGSADHGETSADGPYNYMGRVGATLSYRVNMQDSVDEVYFGRDGGGGYYDTAGNFHGDIDGEPQWNAASGQKTTTVRCTKVESSWTLALFDYKGKRLGNASTGMAQFYAPLLWGSYGLNASAGLKNVKGSPVLITEYSKWGIFPETLRSAKTTNPYVADNLKQKMRFRHGGMANRGDLRDPATPSYRARQRANVGFLDSHIERLGPDKLANNGWVGWYGRRTTGTPTF